MCAVIGCGKLQNDSYEQIGSEAPLASCFLQQLIKMFKFMGILMGSTVIIGTLHFITNIKKMNTIKHDFDGIIIKIFTFFLFL